MIKNKNILLVEDDRDISEALKELLELHGYIVTSAYNGSEALLALRSGAIRPAMILLDLMMPIMDGFEFQVEKQKDDSLKDIPVVVMSADGQKIKNLSKESANFFLKKPVDIDEVVEVVSQFCG